MQLYLDTEFNGFGGELIAIALASARGEAFYATCELPAKIDPWVFQHVIPVLHKGPSGRPLLHAAPMPYEAVRTWFHDYISQFENPEIICDWYADAEYFCRMLAGQDHGTSLDFACRITIVKTPPGQPISRVPHNALEDARALMEWHQGLKTAA